MLLDIDSKIIELTKKLATFHPQLDQIEGEIEVLEFQKYDLEDEITGIENQINLLKKKLIQKMSAELDKFTGDKFVDHFIIASMFCCRDDEQRSNQNGVYLTETEMMASDCCRAILINGLDIPKEIQHKVIKWDARGDFESKVVHSDAPYPKLKELINDINNRPAKLYTDIESTKFYDYFNMETYSKNEEREIVVLTFDEVKIAFNKKYLDLAMFCFGGKPFNVNVKGKLEPILLTSDDIQNAILPIRLQGI